MSTVRFRSEAPQYAAVAEWQTRYFEGVVIVRSCEFKSHQPHHNFSRFLVVTTKYAVVAELADALSSGGSGVIRESSNLSNRTTRNLLLSLCLRVFYCLKAELRGCCKDFMICNYEACSDNGAIPLVLQSAIFPLSFACKAKDFPRLVSTACS